MTYTWDWYLRRMRGEDVPAVMDDPQPSFLRNIRKSRYGGKKYATPVAFYPVNGGEELRCRTEEGDIPLEQGKSLWNTIHDNTVDEKWYREVAEAEPMPEAWRDGLPLRPQPGDNEPPEDMSFESLKEKIDDLSREAKQRLDGPPIETEYEASIVGNLAQLLGELHAAADMKRSDERKPHDEAVKEIQKKWAPVLLAAEVYRNLKYKLIGPWLQKLKREAEQKVVEAAVTGEAIPAEKKPKVTTRGRAMSLRTRKRAEIVDYAACLLFFSENPAVKLTVQDLANKAVRATLTVPGVKVIEEEEAV